MAFRNPMENRISCPLVCVSTVRSLSAFLTCAWLRLALRVRPQPRALRSQQPLVRLEPQVAGHNNVQNAPNRDREPKIDQMVE